MDPRLKLVCAVMGSLVLISATPYPFEKITLLFLAINTAPPGSPAFKKELNKESILLERCCCANK
jgi:hypothetical protein